MTAVKEFTRSFWQAIGDPNNSLIAIRQFLTCTGMLCYVLVCMALGQWLDRR